MKVDLRRRRDLGGILDDSFGIYRANWRTLLLVSTAVVVPVYLLVYGVGLGWLWSGYPETSGDTVRLADVADSLAGLAAQLLVVTPLVTAMAVHVVQAAAEGRRAPAGETFTAGFDAFARLFLAVILVAAGVALGLVLFIVPGLILAIRWAVVPQAVVVEGRERGDALRRSMELTRGEGWFTFFVLLVANLLVGVGSAVAVVPLDLAAKAADAHALTLLGQALGTIFSLPLLAVAYTLLYHSLVVGKGGAAAEPPAGIGEVGPEEVGPRELPGVPGTFGDGWAPPAPPARDG